VTTCKFGLRSHRRASLPTKAARPSCSPQPAKDEVERGVRPGGLFETGRCKPFTLPLITLSPPYPSLPNPTLRRHDASGPLDHPPRRQITGLDANHHTTRSSSHCSWSPSSKAVPTSSRRWRSNPSRKCSQTRGTVTSTIRMAAHLSVCVRCGAGAGCSAIKYQSLPTSPSPIPPNRVFRPRRLLHLRTFSRSIPWNQAERGHGPIIVLKMARVRQYRRNLFYRFSNQSSAHQRQIPRTRIPHEASAHGPIIVPKMAWVRQSRRDLFHKFSHQ